MYVCYLAICLWLSGHEAPKPGYLSWLYCICYVSEIFALCYVSENDDAQSRNKNKNKNKNKSDGLVGRFVGSLPSSVGGGDNREPHSLRHRRSRSFPHNICL